MIFLGVVKWQGTAVGYRPADGNAVAFQQGPVAHDVRYLDNEVRIPTEIEL